MTDLISRQAAIDALDGEITVTGRANAEAVIGYAKLVTDRIKRLPPAQPEKCEDCGNFNKTRSLIPQPERKVGRWEVHNVVDYAQRPTGRKIGRCPFCGYLTNDFRTRMEYYRNLTHFCANCGADMEGSDGRDPGRL